MNNSDIAVKVLEISNNKCMLDYNVFESGTNEIIQDSRLKRFTIIHKVEDGGIIIEYVKGKFFVSYFFNPKLVDRIDFSEILAKCPVRFQEIVARIRKFKNNPISTQDLEDLFNIAMRGVPKHKYSYASYLDSRYAILLLAIEDLIKNKKQHTYLYANKPLFGKMNTHFRASVKNRIPSIGEIIDTEK